MTTKYLYILLALTLLTACTKNNDSDPNIPSGKDLFVAISCENGDGNPDVSSSSIAPHTSIDNNDWATTHWDDNDRIAIWASADGGSSYTLEAQTFSLAYFRTEFSAGERLFFPLHPTAVPAAMKMTHNKIRIFFILFIHPPSPIQRFPSAVRQYLNSPTYQIHLSVRSRIL